MDRTWDGDVFATVKVRMQVICETNREPTPKQMLNMLRKELAERTEEEILEYISVESIDGSFID